MGRGAPVVGSQIRTAARPVARNWLSGDQPRPWSGTPGVGSTVPLAVATSQSRICASLEVPQVTILLLSGEKIAAVTTFVWPTSFWPGLPVVTSQEVIV